MPSNLKQSQEVAVVANSEPTDIILENTAVIQENADPGIVVARLQTIDPDNHDTFTYSLAENEHFEVRSNQIVVKDGADINFESAQSHAVEIRVTDSGGNTYAEIVVIHVANINEAPTDLELTADTIDEHALAGTIVAKLSATDEDSGDSFIYSMADNDNFEIDGDKIKVKAGSGLDFETDTSHDLEITVTDSGELSYIETVTIAVNNNNDVPVITIVDTRATEDTSQIIATADDIDGFIDSSSFVAEHGIVAMDAAGNLTYTPDEDYNGTDTVRLTVTDNGGAIVTETIHLIVDPINDAPVAIADISTPSAVEVNTSDTNGALVLDSTGSNPELFGGATAFDVSITLTSDDNYRDLNSLMSYNTDSQDNEVLLFNYPSGNVYLDIGGERTWSSIAHLKFTMARNIRFLFRGLAIPAKRFFHWMV